MGVDMTSSKTKIQRIILKHAKNAYLLPIVPLHQNITDSQCVKFSRIVLRLKISIVFISNDMDKKTSVQKTNKYNPISSDSIKIYGFRFGLYRYQVEHFDHNKDKNVQHDDNSNILKVRNYWDTLFGTKIYRFLDWDFEQSVSTLLYMNQFIEEDELKKMILDDVIDWKFEDPYEFKNLFLSGDEQIHCAVLFPRETEHIEHNYPICEEPYEKCPICGNELDGSAIEIECAEDVFNSKSGYGLEGDSWGEWDEIHRCPHCNKLFCVKMWT